MLGICVHKGHASNAAIRQSGEFGINIPTVDMVAVTDYCGIVSGSKVDLPTNTLFIGEIVNIYSEEKYLENGKPDVKKMRPFLLTMPDNRFWSVGEHVGNAWKDGVKYKDQINRK
jgi:flavin reductase (DIM6/NTAB) family NADH-FMN oxidoreductase RutF